MSDLITKRDVLVSHAQRPSHPPVDTELAFLRDKWDLAEEEYDKAVDARFYEMLHGEEGPDLAPLLQAVEKAKAAFDARWAYLHGGESLEDYVERTSVKDVPLIG